MMRTLSRMSAELPHFELGLELELNSDDVAAAEAAVAAHGESFICSCCDLELNDKESLHLHQISQHSISQLSIALLSLRGFDMSSTLETEILPDLHCPDSESESTVSAHSSIMLGFTNEFSTTVPQNETCAIVGPHMSDPGVYGCGDTQCVSLTNAPQHPDFSGSLSYGEDSMGVKTYDVDVNRNHHSADDLQLKVGYSKANSCQSVSQSSILTNTVDLSKTSGVTGNQRQTAFSHDFHEAEVTDFQQNKYQKNRKKLTQPMKERKQVTNGDSFVNPAASRIPKLTCTKPKAKDDRKQSSNNYDGREFCCDICGRKYKRKSHLGRHIRMHSGVRPFACTLCEKRFAVRSILKQHMRVHTGERPFKCLFCFQRFPQKSGLVTHMMLHTGKPFKCDMCDKSFVSNHKLNVHKKAHEEQSGRWPTMGPHSCPTCSTRFFTSSALAEHAKVHVVGTSSGAAQWAVELNASTTGVRSPHDSSDNSRTTNDVNLVTHNSQEVTAGQALLTLMDSNSVQGEEESCSKNCRCTSDGNYSEESEVPDDFEFCDAALDWKSSIYFKEESFEFEDNLPDMPKSSPPGNN